MGTSGEVIYNHTPGAYGIRLSPHLGVVSWLGMTEGRIDCHVYVLEGSDGIVLVDAGTAWGRGRILRNMRHWGWHSEKVSAVLITHWHVDHASGAHLWQREGARIFAHPSAEREASYGYKGEPGVEVPLPSWKADNCLLGGETILLCGFKIVVIYTPGHTDGCLSFFTEIDGAKWLFTGDVIMSNARPGWKGQWNRQKLVDSLTRLATIEFDHLGHGHDVCLNDKGALFRRALDLSARDPQWQESDDHPMESDLHFCGDIKGCCDTF